MGKSLAKLIKENQASDTLNAPAFYRMLKELDAIGAHRDLFAQLMKFEGEPAIEYPLNADLGTLSLLSFSTKKIPAENPMYIACQASEYDPWNDMLLASDYANYLGAIRANIKAGIAYGEDDIWIIWLRDGNTLIKFVAKGLLSALFTEFPDAVTREIRKMAGVDVASMRKPILIARATKLPAK